MLLARLAPGVSAVAGSLRGRPPRPLRWGMPVGVSSFSCAAGWGAWAPLGATLVRAGALCFRSSSLGPPLSGSSL
eukprot:1054232-Pyramimonas_sp.AAC.1